MLIAANSQGTIKVSYFIHLAFNTLESVDIKEQGQRH